MAGEGRTELELFLDNAQASRAARSLEADFDRVGKSVSKVAGTFDRELTASATRTSRVIQTQFTQWGRYFESTTRYAEGLGRRMQFIEQQTKQATEAMRAFNVEQRGGGRIASPGVGAAAAGIGGQIQQGAAGYFIGGGVAGATIFALSAVTDFAKDSGAAYLEATRGAAFLEATANKTGQSYRALRREVDSLNDSFAISRNEAQTSLAQAERLVSRVGLAGRGGDLVRAVLRSEVGAGLGPEATPTILAGLASGEEEQYRKLFGETPSVSYKRALRGTGRSIDSLTEEEKAVIRINRAFEDGNANLEAYNRYLQSAAGTSDRIDAIWKDIKTQTGEFAASFFGANGGVVGYAARNEPHPDPQNPFVGIASAYRAAVAGGGALVGGVVDFLTGAAKYGREQEKVLRPGADLLDLLQARTPLDRIRVEGDIRARGIIDKYADDPATRGRLLSQNAQRTQLEIGEASRQIFQQLDTQIATLKLKYVGADNPIAALIMQGRLEMQALNREVAKLGPEFAEKGTEAKEALARVQALGVASLRGQTSLEVSTLQGRLRDLDRARYGTAGLAPSSFERAADAAALESRGLDALLERLGGRSAAGPDISATDQLFRDALGRGGYGTSTKAGRARLLEAALAGKVDLSSLSIDQQSLVAGLALERRGALQYDIGSQQSRLSDIISNAATARREFESALDVFGPAERAKRGEAYERGKLLEGFGGVSAADLASDARALGVYQGALIGQVADLVEQLRKQVAAPDPNKPDPAVEKENAAELNKLFKAIRLAGIKPEQLAAALLKIAEGPTAKVQVDIRSQKQYNVAAEDKTAADRDMSRR